MSSLRVQSIGAGVRLSVRVQPRAATNGIAGVHGESLRIRLTAPPVEGAANDALVEFLAATFDIPRRAITIVAGTNSRSKIVELAGLSEARVRSMVEHGA